MVEVIKADVTTVPPTIFNIANCSLREAAVLNVIHLTGSAEILEACSSIPLIPFIFP